MAQYQGFISPSYSHRNFQYSSQTTKNWLLEQGVQTGKAAAPFLFVPRRGLRRVKDDFVGISRGSYVASNNKSYFVFGEKLHEFDGSSWITIDGNIPGGSTPVKMIDNGTHLFIVADNAPHYMAFSTRELVEASGGAYGRSTTLAYLDGYVIFSRLNSGQFYWTNLASTTANALNFATAESSPDKLVSVV